jgi:flagellar M-ring protein FliF
VRAIQNLVAGAVPNLKPDKVTVVDQHAKTLSGGDTGMAAEADGRKSEIEQRIAKQVKTMVEGIVGAGKARVNVSADVDMAHVTTQKETFDPDGQVVRSEVTTDENSKENSSSGGAVGAAAGQTSAAANIPGGGGPSSSDGNSSGKQESTTNYEISKTVTTQVSEPGQIKKISVAVAVDGVTGPPGKNGKAGAYTPLPAAEMTQIESLVKAAVGFDQTRGDTVTVVNVKFPTADDGEGVSSANPLMGFDKNDIMRGAEILVMGIVAILMMLFIVRPLLKGALSGPGGPMALLGGPQVQRLASTPDGQQMQITVDPATGQTMALPAPNPDGIEAKIDIARIEGQVKASSVKRVSEFVDKHPEESVSIIRSWLHESA